MVRGELGRKEKESPAVRRASSVPVSWQASDGISPCADLPGGNLLILM